MTPTDYAPYLTAEFLGVLVLAVVAPFRARLAAHWLPLVALAVALLLHVGIAFHVHSDPVLAALVAINTALVASGLYGWAKTAARVLRAPKVPPGG